MRLGGAVGIDGPRIQVVGERHSRADEDSIGQLCGFIDQGIVLDFAVVAYGHTWTNVCAASNVAALSYNRTFSDLRQMPDISIFTDFRQLGNIGAAFNMSHFSPKK
ncbi:hypothetical protein AA310_06975 [Arthrobacter sp. YC-RL1]|nr:hypothetical protein ATC04_10925 [Arthrobacter sp. YC-RL1]KLI87704.1 hypothetical protein AA310_06975 [Arthrobacter sp. YC-RL1]